MAEEKAETEKANAQEKKPRTSKLAALFFIISLIMTPLLFLYASYDPIFDFLYTYSFVCLVILLVSGAVLIALYIRNADKFKASKQPIAGILSLVIGVLFNLIVVFSSAPFVFVSRGSHIRPMGWAGLMFLVAMSALLLGLPLCTVSLIVDKKKIWAVIGLILVLSPLPLAVILLNVLAFVCGFELAP